jgi:hypothetical protein
MRPVHVGDHVLNPAQKLRSTRARQSPSKVRGTRFAFPYCASPIAGGVVRQFRRLQWVPCLNCPYRPHFAGFTEVAARGLFTLQSRQGYKVSASVGKALFCGFRRIRGVGREKWRRRSRSTTSLVDSSVQGKVRAVLAMLLSAAAMLESGSSPAIPPPPLRLRPVACPVIVPHGERDYAPC